MSQEQYEQQIDYLVNETLPNKMTELDLANKRVAELEAERDALRKGLERIRRYSFKPGDPDDHITLKGVLADIQREARALLEKEE